MSHETIKITEPWGQWTISNGQVDPRNGSLDPSSNGIIGRSRGRDRIINNELCSRVQRRKRRAVATRLAGQRINASRELLALSR